MTNLLELSDEWELIRLLPLLALLVFFLVINGTGLSLAITPIVADLSIFAASCENLDASSVFSAFNMSFSVGTFIGPIIAGQLINTIGIDQAWLAMLLISALLLVGCLIPTFLYVGGAGGARFGGSKGAEKGGEKAGEKGAELEGGGEKGREVEIVA